MSTVAPIPPDSGHLFQEDLCKDPFWMLVACILVNRTHWRQVEPVLTKLMARVALRPGDSPAKGLLSLPDGELTDLVRPLGFQNRRATVLRRFALDWLDQPPRDSVDVSTMAGCGDYAVQSWEIFVEKREPDGPITDNKLLWYVLNRPINATGR